jgi:RNA polymerase sigma factor (sigma-70 family)
MIRRFTDMLPARRTFYGYMRERVAPMPETLPLIEGFLVRHLPNSPVDEASLARRALAGQRDAWETLIARHDHRVVMSLVARGVPLDQARDFSQRAWLRLIERQRAGRLIRLELPGLAMAQARFLALDTARRDGAGLRASAATQDADISLEDRILGRERLARAQAALDRCSSSAQEVFRLVYGSPGLPHDEAARRVGLSLQRVRHILSEVRTQLRAALEEIEEKEP